MPKYDSPPSDPLGIHYNPPLQPQKQENAHHHIHNPFFTGRPRSPFERHSTPPTDRHTLIKRLKNVEAQRPSHHDNVYEEEYSYQETPEFQEDQNEVGLEISRPRSALHRGDFREDLEPQQHLATSPVVPWHHNFPSLGHGHPDVRPLQYTTQARPRAVSHASLSGSFSYQPPTSPLVHQANAADMPDYPSERHSTHRLMHSHLPRHASLRGLPYQAHQPRRSIGSLSSLTQSTFPVARRPSISDASPLQHAPMVGSYEESILRGRMSTTPSKPLDFVAQIGVLGKGDCKPSLRCPPHVAIPFPAVFYSYASGTHTDPEPSPYVGMVDLENTIKRFDDAEGKRHRGSHVHLENHDDPSTSQHLDSAEDAKSRKRRQHKISRQKHSPKAPPGGSYRIPQIGQLQIVLKNPNKTAVKLFLVPYDLSDMDPGTKTFIRQRSYSAGPLIDMPLSSRKNYGTDRPEAALGGAENPYEKPILRYLIHLHICCPSRGRYYLYQNIRVVFANRVPDGKEKLRSEVQMPEPRYSAYKAPTSGTSVDTTAAEVQKRRRSAIFPSTGYAQYSRPSASMDSTPHSLFVGSYSPMPTLESRPSSRGIEDLDMDRDSPPVSPTAEIQRFTFERGSARDAPRAESLLSRKLRDLEMRGKQGL